MAATSSLARLLRAGVLFQLLVALAWFAWRWPAAPAQAALGAMAILLAVPAVLACEFAVLGVLARKDTVPAPTAIELAAAWLGESCQSFRVFYWRQAFRWRATQDHLEAGRTGQRGVVFIHGFFCNRGFWTPWMQRLRARGHPFIAVNLEPLFTSIDDYAPVIDDAVRRVSAASGLPPVLICHSMGGIAARAWLRQAGELRRVYHLITIGSPHNGTWLGRFSRTPNGRQMRIRSGWLQALSAHEASAGLPPCTSWYTNCDNIVFPTSTAILPGADNRLVRGLAHVDLGFREEVIAGSLALVEGSPPTPSM